MQKYAPYSSSSPYSIHKTPSPIKIKEKCNGKSGNKITLQSASTARSYQSTPNRTYNQELLDDNENVYAKCCNCESMILLSEADSHSRNCTELTQKSIQSSFLPLNDQINIQIETLRGLVNSKEFSEKMTEDIASLMDEVQSLNDFTSQVIIAIRKLLYRIRMMIAAYKGSYNGLLIINKLDVAAKQKYDNIVANYKNLYTRQMLSDNSQLSKIIKNSRTSSYNSPTNQSVDILGNNTNILDFNKSQDFSDTRDSRMEDMLKRQFYYKCIMIKKNLGKKSYGFWVDSAPLYIHTRKSKIPVSEWEHFIQQQLTTNVMKWLDSNMLDKLNTHKRVIGMTKKLNIINESKQSQYEECI